MRNRRRTMVPLAKATWRTSSYSGGNNECVEVADSVPGCITVRDSKCPGGPVIGFSRGAWKTFLDHLR